MKDKAKRINEKAMQEKKYLFKMIENISGALEDVDGFQVCNTFQVLDDLKEQVNKFENALLGENERIS